MILNYKYMQTKHASVKQIIKLLLTGAKLTFTKMLLVHEVNM